VVTPLPLLERHGADAVRYWAASGRPGTDTAVDEGQMKVGRRLAIKILNASKFVLGRLGDGPVPDAASAATPVDRDLLVRLAGVVVQATASLEGYDYTRALEAAESFFWSFCDDYLELVKTRAYGSEGDPDQGRDPATTSARATLAVALSVQLRLFAPFLPFVTEEAWRWWHDGSVHRAAWPTVDELGPAPAEAGDGDHSGVATPVLDMAAEMLGAVRREKTAQKRSMRAPVSHLHVVDTAERLAALTQAEPDIRDACAVVEITMDEVGEAGGSEPSVSVMLGPE
jgi:valyl-tRNA synthetase